MKRQVDATGDGYLEPTVPFGCGSVVLEHVAHIARLPAGIPNDVAGIRHLEQGQFLAVRIHSGGKAAQQARPVARCHMSPRLEGGRGAGNGRVDLRPTERRNPSDALPCRGVSYEGGAALFILHALIIADGTGTRGGCGAARPWTVAVPGGGTWEIRT